MNPKKVFLYAEMQVAVPFGELDWPAANAAMKNEKGLLRKTWLSGIGTHTVGGFYEFDSLDNARAYADGLLLGLARQSGASLSVKLFDGDIVEEASRDMKSPHYN